MEINSEGGSTRVLKVVGEANEATYLDGDEFVPFELD